MKNLFAILMVFCVLIGTSITHSVQASNVGNDFDVGYALHAPTLTATIADHDTLPATTEFNAVPTMTAIKINPYQSCATRDANRYEAIASKRSYQYWEGGDSKASIRKACAKYYQYLIPAHPMPCNLKFGKGNRRLS